MASKEKKILNKQFLDSIPHHPGVYLMRNDKGNILYVGKAIDLRKRLASYSRHLHETSTKTAVLLDKSSKIDTILTRTEKEALLLESSLIKKHKPKYNVILRDDKNYPYIKVTVGEKWPRVIMTRKRLRDKAKYFGPYSSASAMWETIRYLRKNFPLRQCKGKELKKRKRPCSNYQMGRCLAPCAGLADHGLYMEFVENTLFILEGRANQVVRRLKGKMERASMELRFEDAALIRDRIAALEKTLEKQVMVTSHFKNQDVVGFARKNVSVAVSFLFIREGSVTGNRSFYLPECFGDDSEILTEALERFYGDEERDIPKEILLPFAPAKQELLEVWFSSLKEGKIHFKVPQKGDGLKLTKLASENANHLFGEQEKKRNAWESLAKAMVRDLKLTKLPERVECFDISNIGGKQPVGSLVSFYRGEKDAANYRHYKIRNVEGINDYAMMDEVLNRRFAKDKETFPDLLLIDGGKGHLNIALTIASNLKISNIDILAIAKEKDKTGEKIYRANRKDPILLLKNSPVLLFLMKIRDEAHRFGITLHRRLRKKATIKSALDSIPGIGPVKKKALLNEFRSIKKVGEQRIEDLCKIRGINTKLAEIILKTIQNK